MADNTSPLPPDVIELILSSLPLKYLLRLKTVSKSWNTMISDPAFARIHHQRAKYSTSDNLFLFKKARFSSEGFSLVRLDDRKLRNVRVLPGPIPYRREHVLCFCNGLLLVEHLLLIKIALWNPSTGAEKRLLLPYMCFMSNYGLSHDPITDDFKVVIMDWDYYTVYSFKNDSWKEKIKYKCVPHVPTAGVPGVCVDGASYWVLSGQKGTRVIYFDPRDDKFKILSKPGNVVGNQQIYVVELGGRLCLYCHGGHRTTIRIWTKEKGIDNESWETLMVVENVRIPIRSFQPQCFIGNKIVIRKKTKNVLVTKKSDYKLVVYNPYEKRFEKFEDTKVFGRLGLVPYVDSPLFPSTQQQN